MTTIIVKSVGVMTPRSRPTLRTTSSIRPRVFISTPRAVPVRQVMPTIRAAARVPPTFPSVATTMIRAQAIQPSQPGTRPISVRMPANAKNAGSSSTRTRLSRRFVSACANRLSCGMTAPNRNAPNSAWMPIASVTSAEISKPDDAHGDVTVAPFAFRGADQAAEARPHDDEHHRDEHEGECDDRQCGPGAGLHHADDEREQAPRRHVVDRRAGERDGAERRPRHAELRQDARQHGKGRDRHRDADEQREARERDVGAREPRIEEQRQGAAQHERHDDARV